MLMQDSETSGTWRITLRVPGDALAAYEMVLEGLGGALSIGLPDAADGSVPLALDVADEPDRAALTELLESVAGSFDMPPPDFVVEALAARDWVGESQRALAPIRSRRFWVHGGHVGEPAPQGLSPLLVEAGQAFGTGRHETTLGCLLALEDLARERSPCRVLDLGCGSGLLALAAARLWPSARVLAADNDPIAVAVAHENAAINRLGRRVATRRSEGYRAGPLRGRGPFDLVIANILARPLCALAPGLRANLVRGGGRAVLSGLLRSQERQVLAPHEALGLRLVRRYRLGEWSVLVLRG